MRIPPFVSELDARSVMGAKELVMTQDVAFRALSNDPSVQVRRAIAPTNGGSLVAMPASLPSGAALGVKVLTAMPGNRRLGLPTNQAMIVMFDPRDGSPKAVMDAAWLTAARTGATAALATNALANEAASSLAVLGSGPVADAAIRCLVATRPVLELRLWSRTKGRAAGLARALAADEITESIQVDVVGSPTAAVADADMVVTATSSPTPLINGRDLAPGCHVSVLGGADGGREIDLIDVVGRRIVIDGWEAAWIEAAVLRRPNGRARYRRADVVGDLGAILLGRSLGRTSLLDTTVFVSVGIAIQDITLAGEILRRLGID